MPTYDYKCCGCGFEFEEMRKIADRKETKCPQCEGISKQQVSAPQFKLDQSFPGENMKWGRERKKLNSKIDTDLAH